MKKLIALIITIALSFSVLAACEFTPQQSTSNNSTSTSAPSSSYERIDVHFNVINERGNSSGDNLDNSSSSSQDSSSGGSIGEDGPALPQGDLKTVLQTIRKTVVEVYAYKIDEVTKAVAYVNAGSGVIVANSDDLTKSYIVTCHNVIEDVDSVEVRTIDGETLDAKFIGSDPDSNLCVMSIDKYLEAAIVYTGDDIEVGEAVVAIGNSLGTLGGTVTTGIVSANNKDIVIDGKTKSLLQTNAAINSGNSGGGLFTQTGYLIGIVDAKYNEDFLKNINGIGLAIPSGDMLDVATELMRTYTGERPGYIEGKYNLGVVVNDYFSSKWTTQPYVYIVSLDPSGCLFKAGLQVDDRLVSVVYGDSVYTVTDAKSFVEFINSTTFQIGDTLTFNIIRKEISSSVRVTVLQYIYGLS